MFKSYVGLISPMCQWILDNFPTNEVVVYWKILLIQWTAHVTNSEVLKEMERKDRLFQDQKVSVGSFWIYIDKGG